MKRTTILFIFICALILVPFFILGDAEQSFEERLTALTHHKLKYALFSFLLLASDILLPVPNSVIMYGNGLVLGGIAGTGLSLLALMTGATAGYWLGRVTSYGLRASADAKAVAFWKKYGALAILVTRVVPVLSESICILGGHLRMPFGRYLLLNLLGYLPIALIFAWFGRYGLDQNAFLISFGCSIALAGFFGWVARKWVS